MSKITHDQKETALEAIREHGTMKAGAKAAGVDVKTLNNEMNRSLIFKKRLLEAREEGHRNVADKAIEMIKLYASGELPKTDRNVLTANIALANAYAEGFRGTTKSEVTVDHNVRVITAVPRPKYEEIPPPTNQKARLGKYSLTSQEDKAKLKELNAGKLLINKGKE